MIESVMFVFGRKSLASLEWVRPDLILVVSRGLLYTPYDFMITEGRRFLERQKRLVAAGFSWTLNSKHLVQPDGFAHAIDVMAVGDLDADGDIDAQDLSLTWDREIYGEIAKGMKKAATELGRTIRWGGDFKATRSGEPRFDGPHFEIV